jgi:hypothetical protein
MTDIAIDGYGVLYGITFGVLYTCHPVTAECWWLATLPGSFNGLTMLPVGVVEPGSEVLVGVTEGGDWHRLDVAAGVVTATLLGSYGGGYESAGDAFSIAGFGTFAAVNKPFQGNNWLVSLDPATGKVLGDVGPIEGFSTIWGLAGWTGRAYAFDLFGAILRIEVSSAEVSLIMQTRHSWWGAGVRTQVE